ncbi:MAG: hypothetical protein HOH58_12180 [Opitutaceae bacterium]|nr:hypothetical protein [Opitutaceae bacterium]
MESRENGNQNGAASSPEKEKRVAISHVLQALVLLRRVGTSVGYTELNLKMKLLIGGKARRSIIQLILPNSRQSAAPLSAEAEEAADDFGDV